MRCKRKQRSDLSPKTKIRLESNKKVEQSIQWVEEEALWNFHTSQNKIAALRSLQYLAISVKNWQPGKTTSQLGQHPFSSQLILVWILWLTWTKTSFRLFLESWIFLFFYKKYKSESEKMLSSPRAFEACIDLSASFPPTFSLIVCAVLSDSIR